MRRFEQLANFDQLLARAVALRTAGGTPQQIAACPNAEGFLELVRFSGERFGSYPASLSN